MSSVSPHLDPTSSYSSPHSFPPSVGFQTEILQKLLLTHFGFKSFRPHQKEVCLNVLKGKDTLLVMPTGAGKSLCYQLPGLARQGTTIVISPLLALIEDQVDKLNKIGLKAERIHSGRTREASRKVCYDYFLNLNAWIRLLLNSSADSKNLGHHIPLFKIIIKFEFMWSKN